MTAILAQAVAQEDGEPYCGIDLAYKETGKHPYFIIQLNNFQFWLAGWLPNAYKAVVQWVRSGSRDVRTSLFYPSTAVKKFL